MARLHGMSTIVLLVLLSVRLSLSADPLENAPTPAPEIDGHSFSPSSGAGAPESPSQSPGFGSPPAPPAPDLASSPAPPPADSPPKKSPSPAPVDSADNSDSYPYAEEANESSGGMKGGQKAGIVVGVIAGVCLVGLGGMVYKKRRENLRRSQYGYAARRGLL